MLTLYPAIDIRDGRAVRLLRGDYDHETAYDADPVDAARRWVEGGAAIVHVVDLDGARAGAPVNLELVARIVDASTCRSSSAAGSATSTASRPRSPPGPSGRCSAPRPSATRTCSAGSPTPTATGSSPPSTPVADGSPSRAGSRRRGPPSRTRSPPGLARDPPVRLHAGRGGRDARGARHRGPRHDPRRLREGRVGADLLRRRRLARRPGCAWASRGPALTESSWEVRYTSDGSQWRGRGALAGNGNERTDDGTRRRDAGAGKLSPWGRIMIVARSR